MVVGARSVAFRPADYRSLFVIRKYCMRFSSSIYTPNALSAQLVIPVPHPCYYRFGEIRLGTGLTSPAYVDRGPSRLTGQWTARGDAATFGGRMR